MIEKETQQNFYHIISFQNLVNLYPQSHLQRIILLRLKQKK